MATPRVLDSLQSTACPAFATDGKGQVLGLNQAAETLLGYGSDAVRGRRCREVFAGRDRFSNLFCLERCAVREMAARGEAVNPFDLCLKTVSGAMLEVSLSVVCMPGEGRTLPTILHLFGASARPAGEGSDGNVPNGLTPREHVIKSGPQILLRALAVLMAGVECAFSMV